MAVSEQELLSETGNFHNQTCTSGAALQLGFSQASVCRLHLERALERPLLCAGGSFVHSPPGQNLKA